MKTFKFFIVFIVLQVFGCQGETDNEKYYESVYQDEIFAALKADSIYIVLTQNGTSKILKDSIPCLFVNDNHLGDTIKMGFEVAYGGCSSTPTPYKTIVALKDTMLVWYGLGLNIYSTPENKDVINTSIGTSPSYYSIQSITIKKSTNKLVTVCHRKIVQ